MRLTWWVGAFVVGVSTALLTDPGIRLITVVAAIASVCSFILVKYGYRAFAEGVACCVIGAYAGIRASQPVVLPPGITAALDADRRVVVTGWALTAPEAAEAGCRFRLAIERVDGVMATATAVVAVSKGVPSVLPGDAVTILTRLRSVRGLKNPDVADPAFLARVAGTDVFAGVSDHAAVTVNHPAEFDFRSPSGTTLLRGAARARIRLGGAIDEVVTGPAGVLLHTAVLGERRGNDPLVEDGFRAAGATHVLSVSGLHLAAIAFVFFAGFRGVLAAVPRLPLWYPPRALAALMALPFIAFYTALTGNAIATVRSALMMGFALGALVVGRPATPVVAIAAAVSCVLCWSPLAVADVSFQLSVVSVLALAVLARRLTPARRATQRVVSAASRGERRAVRDTAGAHRWRDRGSAVVHAVARFGAATVTAGLATAPLVAHHFGEVTLAAPVGNALLVPLVELVVVPCGLGGAALGALFGRPFGFPLLFAAGWAARAALTMAEFFRIHAPVVLTRLPNVFETAALTLGIAGVLAAVGRHLPSSGWLFGNRLWRRSIGVLAALSLSAAVASLIVREVRRRSNPDVVVTFLDVGQGDAAVVQLPGGRTLLVDGGGTYDGSFDPGARVVEPFLRARGITHLDAVALSHPHPDHLGGLHRIIARFPVDNLWTSGDDGHNPEYFQLLAEGRSRGVATPVPSRWQIAAARIDPLGPFVCCDGGGVDGERIGPPEGTTVNDASLVLRVTFAGRAFLFTGDIESNGEGELRGRTTVGQTVSSDILKVPHHGSRTSSSVEFLDVVRPRIAIMSLGWMNRFHFPRPEIVARYQDRRIRLLRTDINGAITITVAPDGEMSVSCARGCG